MQFLFATIFSTAAKKNCVDGLGSRLIAGSISDKGYRAG